MDHYERANRFYREKNFTEAYEWYRKGAEEGDIRCECELGILLFIGLGAEKNLKLSRQYLEEAHRQQISDVATYYLACLEKREGNYETYSALLKAASANGVEPAMTKLGYEYEKGRLLPKDLDKAWLWYGKAIAAGHIGARICKARILIYGYQGLTGTLRGFTEFLGAVVSLSRKDVEDFYVHF